MKKTKIILGFLIAMFMAIGGASLLNVQPSVFATEIQNQQVETIENEAGTFTGQGYYTLGEIATLTASMNAGFKFDGWVSVNEQDEVLEILSTSEEYTFVVDSNIKIKAQYTKIKYSVEFSKDLYIDYNSTELKDFTYKIINNTTQTKDYYYDNQLQIIVNIKNDLYIYDLNNTLITVNNETIYDLLRKDDSIIENVNIVNNNKTGFSQFVLTLNIRENLTIDIDYSYMYQLEIVSGNDIPVDELMQFITLTNQYSQPDETKYVYLVRADKSVSITTNQGNDVYQFVNSQFQGQDPSIIYSQSYTLYNDSTFTVTYSKKGYSINFVSYLTNLYGGKDIMQTPLYNISTVFVEAGDSISFVYDETNKSITITDIKDNIVSTYQYPTNIFGYKFVGFALNGEIINQTSYTLSSTAPSNVEIQLVFEYIEYDLDIKLVDDYFSDDITSTIKYDNDKNKLISGTTVTINATTTKYTLVGWSWVQNPQPDDYVDIINQDALSDEYSFMFVPNGDDALEYIIYLDVDYRYLSATYSLRANSITKNTDYDIVSVDLTNNTIIFSDSEDINTAKTITYLDSDITTDGSKTIINTDDFGQVEIDGETLSYKFNLITISSISKDTKDGVDTYIFDKYTYWGDLKIGVIEYITILEQGDKVILSFGERLSGEIYQYETTKTYDNSIGAYVIDYYYSMNLYMSGEQYDYITLCNINYYFNGEKFVPNNAKINTPNNVERVITKGEKYSIQLNNLLPNSVIMYSTQSTDSTNYRFTSFTNHTGSSLWNFEHDGYNTCILNINLGLEINVEYRRMANNIALIVNNESAYKYEDITFTLENQDGITNGSGNIISAIDNDIITITIAQNSIAKGYKFDNYLFDGEVITNSNNPLVLTLYMDSRIYANQTINIEFSPIEYTLNVKYIDQDGTEINQTDANGIVKLQGRDEVLISKKVNLNGEYVFEAKANVGYYVSKAYIGTEENELIELIGANETEQILSNWVLNYLNFEKLIIDNANDSDEVNLYINFAIHTYSVKVYFEISTNATAIEYPTMYINGREQTLLDAEEVENGVNVTKYFVLAEGFEYKSNLQFRLDNFMLGTAVLKWTDSAGKQLVTINSEGKPVVAITNECVLNEITQNTVLKVVLQYVEYSLKFNIVDEQGQECNYGSAYTENKTIKLFEIVNYTINTEIGYILKDKYYYDSTGVVGNENINSGFRFNPANFKIENSVATIYLVFSLRSVNLTIGNVVEGNFYYFKDYKDKIDELVSYTVVRQRNGETQQLNNETGYKFQTGDVLIMEIRPISIGIELNKVTLGSQNITLDSTYPYQLTTHDIIEEEQVVGMYYVLQVEFEAGIISAMQDEEALKNVLKVKTFNIAYTYNYIDYKFGIRLVRQYGGSTATGNEDSVMEVKDLGFGTEVTFTYNYQGMSTGDGSKFKVDGFTIAGIEQEVTDRFKFNNIELWKQVALKSYIEKLNPISVVLVLKPKITLNNYSTYNQQQGYVYQYTYIGTNQGLLASGDNADVVVGGDFEILIQYSYNAGNSYVDERPIDVGEYPVKIIAKITSENTQVTNIVFEEKVTCTIIQASISVSLKTYNSNNPIVKTYGESMDCSELIRNDIVLDGLFERDRGNITLDRRLTALFSDIFVNTISSLSDVNVSNIYLLDKDNKLSKNYKLSSGSTLIFKNIGKINPAKLSISGFVVKNKIYDGTNQVNVDIESIKYSGIYPGDSVQVVTQNLKFEVQDCSIGYQRQVFINYSNALIGSERGNYEITYEPIYIDIFPSELSYTVDGYGTFKVVDRDLLGIIHINSKLLVRVYEKGSASYNQIYSGIEKHVDKGEKLKICYEVILQLDGINQLIPQGLYVYAPKVNKTTKVLQVPGDTSSQNLQFAQNDGYTIIKVTKGEALIGVVVRTTYLPLWLIVVIVLLSATGVGIIVTLFIIIRRKTKRKYSSYDKI